MPNAESNIAKFFASAPLPAANAVFGIVRSMLKERNALGNSGPTPNAKAARKTRKPRGPNKPKVAAATAAQQTQQAQPGDAAPPTGHYPNPPSMNFSTSAQPPSFIDGVTGKEIVL